MTLNIFFNISEIFQRGPFAGNWKKEPLHGFIQDSSDALEFIFQFVTNPNFQQLSQIILDENNTVFSKYTEDYEEEELRNQD